MSDKIVNITLKLDDKVTKPLRKVQAKFDGFVNQKFGWSKKVSQSFTALSKASGFSKVSKATGELSDSLGKLGSEGAKVGAGLFAGLGLAAGGILALAKNTEEYSGHLVDNVKRIGFNVEAYQELQFAAKKSGVSNEDFDKGLQKMTRSLGEAKSGQGALYGFLKKTNPELLKQVLGAKSNEEAFGMLTNSLGGLKDAQKQAAYANIIFGKSGANFTNLANEGADGIAAMRKEARQLGILTTQQVEEANKFGDTWDALEQIFAGVKNILGAQLIPVLKQLGEQFIAFYKGNKTQIEVFSKQFAEKLPGAIAKLTEAFMGIARVSAILFGIFTFLGDTFGYTATIIGILAATIGKGLTLALWGVIKATWAWGAAILSTPIGWLAVGIGLIIGSLYLLWKHWDSIWGGIKAITSTVIDWITGAFDKVIGKFSGIKDMLPSWLGGKTSAEVNVNNSTSGNVPTAIQNFAQTQKSKNETEVRVLFDNAPKGTRTEVSGSKNVETDMRMGLMGTSTI